MVAQEWRDVVVQEAQQLVKELVATLPKDYSDADAPWRELALPAKKPKLKSTNGLPHGRQPPWRTCGKAPSLSDQELV
jgi:hypothetical protein